MNEHELIAKSFLEIQKYATSQQKQAFMADELIDRPFFKGMTATKIYQILDELSSAGKISFELTDYQTYNYMASGPKAHLDAYTVTLLK
ncbi:hypothetical protein R5Q15_09730 [Oenococcus oeni]